MFTEDKPRTFADSIVPENETLLYQKTTRSSVDDPDCLPCLCDLYIPCKLSTHL